MLPKVLVLLVFKGTKFPLSVICVPLIFVKVHVPDGSILLEAIEEFASLEPLISALVAMSLLTIVPSAM